jgi:hypothetical protein
MPLQRRTPGSLIPPYAILQLWGEGHRIRVKSSSAARLWERAGDFARPTLAGDSIQGVRLVAVSGHVAQGLLKPSLGRLK